MKKKKSKIFSTSKTKFCIFGIWILVFCFFALPALAQSSTDSSEQQETTSDSQPFSNCTASGCAKMYPEDDIASLHHRYEAAGNPCAFNNCAAGDPGSCSYGSSQLACNGGGMKDFLKTLQSNSSIWNSLGGGTYNQMVARACTAPATSFSSAWKSLCSGSNKAAIEKAQEEYMQKMYYDTAAQSIKNNFGIDFNAMSPELQMALYSAAVALGTPGGTRKLMNSIKNNIGDPTTMTEEELLVAMYQRRDYFYGSSSPSIRASVQKRNAREGSEALESYKIRQAWEAEQQKPKDQQKSYAEVVQEVTGRPVCSGNQAGTFNCGASGASGGPNAGSSGGSSSSGNASGAVDPEGQQNCAPSRYIASYGGCMLCPLFAVIYNAASTIAKHASDVFSKPILSVVLVAWAIWIAMQVIKFVSAWETKDGAKLLQEIINKSFVVFIIAYFLNTGAKETAAMFIEPVFNTGFKLAQTFISDKSCSTTAYNIITDGGLPASMGQSILCTLQALQKKLVSTLALGMSSFCIAINVKGTMLIFPSLPYFVSGILIICGALMVMIIYPFLLIDCVLHLAIACALLPFALGVYPFKLTRKYMKPIWDTFVSCMFKFIFVSLIVLVLTNAIELTITQTGVGNLDDTNYMEAIVTTLIWGSVTVIKIVFVLLLAWAVLDSFGDYAGQFTGSIANTDFGSKLGGLAANATKSTGQKLWSGAKKAGSVLKENAKEKLGDMKRDAQSKMIEDTVNNGGGTKEAILDKDNNVIGYKYEIKSRSWLKGREKTKSVSIMNNGTKMVTSSKKYEDGRVVTTKSDGYLKQVETSKDGEVISSSVSIETAGLKAIRNTDGTMNMTALNIAMKDSAFSEDVVKAAALKQYAEESFASMGYKFDGDISENNITTSVDENGNQVLELKGKNSNLKMTLNPNSAQGVRPLVEMQHTDEKGNLNSYATDGMFNKYTAYQTDPKTGKTEKKEKFAMSQYYAQKNKYAVDYDGNFANTLYNRAETAFNKQDIEKMRKQFLSDRQKNKQRRISGIK